MRLIVALSLALCIAGCEPGPSPSPSPSPSPTGSPGPGQPPPGAYDCSTGQAGAGVEASGKRLHRAKNPIRGKYIVWTRSREMGASSVRALAQKLGGTDVKQLGRGFAGRFDEQRVEQILADPEVTDVFEEGLVSVPTPISVSMSLRPAAVSSGLDRVDQRDQPLDGTYSAGDGASGAGVHVGVIDTGVTDHSDFGGRLSPECFTAHTFGGCTDRHGHGTWCAGKVGGNVWGGAKGVTLYSVRVLNEQGSGSTSQVVQGIDWAIQRKRASPSQAWVISLSLGGSPDVPLDDAICRAIDAGIVPVIAAGNDGQDAKNSSPARVWQAITVFATQANNDRAPTWTNFGPITDVGAPGVDECSTSNTGGVACMSGTSMSTPLVASLAALVMGRHPTWTVDEVRDWIVANATPGKVAGLGSGTPNLLDYVRED